MTNVALGNAALMNDLRIDVGGALAQGGGAAMRADGDVRRYR